MRTPAKIGKKRKIIFTPARNANALKSCSKEIAGTRHLKNKKRVAKKKIRQTLGGWKGGKFIEPLVQQGGGPRSRGVEELNSEGG